jgi:hypothetical protein
MVAQYAAGTLAQKGGTAQPWAFFTGFKRPHLGFQVPQRFLDRYRPQTKLAELTAGKHPHQYRSNELFGALAGGALLLGTIRYY